MPRLEVWRTEHNGTRAEASVGGFLLIAATHGVGKPGWWGVHGGGRGSGGDSDGRPTTIADMQDAAEAEVARLLAEDAGVLGLMGLSGTFDDFPILRTGGREFVPVGYARVERARAEAAEARAGELDYRRQMVAECAYVVEQERDTLRARVTALEEAARWIPVSARLPAAGQCVMVPNPMSGKNPFKEVPLYVERYYNHPLRIWLDLDGRTVPPPEYWRPLPAAPEATPGAPEVKG